MNRQKENIDLLIGKVAVICFFLLIFFAFKGTDCPNRDSFTKSAYQTFYRIPIHVTSTIEQNWEVNKLAILVEPIYFSAFYDALITLEFNACNKSNFRIICSNNKVNQLLKNCKEQFIVIKAQIIDFNSFHIRTSLNNEEISLIS